MEQYDDLEGDSPTCFSDVKRRLFQSVPGHPLLMFLTKEKITQELNEFVLQHFEKAISNANRQSIKATWDKVIEAEPLTDADITNLKLIDLTQE